jgi:acetate kinase
VKQEKSYVLAMNGGSSRIKFTLYRMGDSPARRLHGKVERIGFLGIQLDPTRNKSNEPLISAEASRVSVRVMSTDEALMIAKAVSRIAL